MSWVILVAGVAGLTAAACGFAGLTVRSVRRRRYADIAAAVGVAAIVVALMIAFGDRLVR